MYFRSFCFICTSYKATFLNRSDNTWRHLRLHILPLFRLPPPFQRHISLAEWLHRLASQHSYVRVCVANTRVHMRPSSGRFSTCFVLSARSRVCVFTAAWLHIPDISFFAIYMGPSSVTFSTRFVVSAHSPTSAHAFIVTIMKFLLLTPENNAVHRVSRLVIPGNAGYPG